MDDEEEDDGILGFPECIFSQGIPKAQDEEVQISEQKFSMFNEMRNPSLQENDDFVPVVHSKLLGRAIQVKEPAVSKVQMEGELVRKGTLSVNKYNKDKILIVGNIQQGKSSFIKTFSNEDLEIEIGADGLQCTKENKSYDVTLRGTE